MRYYWQKKMGANWIIRFLIVISSCGCSFVVFAESTEGTNNGLRIETEFMAGQKYILDSDEPKPLLLDSKLHPDFIKLLEPYPEALEAAQDSLGYSGITMTGTILMLLGSALALKDTLGDKKDLDNNQFPEEDDDQEKALAIVVVGGIITLIGSTQSQGDMNRALEIFNKNYNNNSRTTLNQQTYTAWRAATRQKGPSLSFGLAEPRRNLVSSSNRGEIFVLTNLIYRF